MGDEPPYQVVGVVNDVKHGTFTAGVQAEYYVDLTRFDLTDAVRPYFVVRSAAAQAVDGAAPSQMLAAVLRQSLTLTGIGAAIRMLVAAGVTRYLESMLFELTPLDPPTFAAVAGLFLVVECGSKESVGGHPLRYKYRLPLTEVYSPCRRLQVLSHDSGGLGTPAIDSSDDL